MSRRITIIQGHPDPAGGHFCHALADAYAQGAASASHQVRGIETGQLEFLLLRNKAEFEHAALPETLIPARDAIIEAEHLVIVFPLWLGTMPALLKGFIEQVMRPGVAFSYVERGFPRKLLGGAVLPAGRDHGHAGPRLSLVVWSARHQGNGAQHLELRRNRPGAPDPLWYGRRRERAHGRQAPGSDAPPRHAGQLNRRRAGSSLTHVKAARIAGG